MKAEDYPLAAIVDVCVTRKRRKQRGVVLAKFPSVMVAHSRQLRVVRTGEFYNVYSNGRLTQPDLDAEGVIRYLMHVLVAHEERGKS